MRYLATVQLKAGSAVERLREDVPVIIDAIDRISKGEREAFFRSSDGILFGFFLISSREANEVRAAIENSTGFRDGDASLVVEIGDKANGVGFSRAWTWLQHHKAK
ncbi:hypothetical protein [Pikeienuella sp. HZG-20]|uniref:hypothetical protein n=1 Tax=Paludibacillus litoralis TaxID=3133267 RepID=UPI0030ED0A7F